MAISLGTAVVRNIPVLVLAPDEACRQVGFLIPGFGWRKMGGLKGHL
jgi:hypothetical protein